MLVCRMGSLCSSYPSSSAGGQAMQKEKEVFLKAYGQKYGYNGTIDEIRQSEFQRFGDAVYLDNIATAQYLKSFLDKYHEDLTTNTYGNPHSSNPSSQLTTEIISETRHRILQYFNTTAEEYSVIFTAGSTASLRLLSESFDWHGRSTTTGHCSCFCYLQSNHTSVIGMREVAISHGSRAVCVQEDDFFQAQSGIFNTNNQGTNKANNVKETGSLGEQNGSDGCPNLFAYPAMCNFSGKKYPPNWVTNIKNGKLQLVDPKVLDPACVWFVLLDAASYISTSQLDLQACPADFVPISFYKLFGFPTGLGALLVKNSSSPVLKKAYYGGGTVLATITSERFHVLKPGLADRFEDGTLPFLDIIALRHAFDTLNQVTGTMWAISEHTFTLAHYVYHKMLSKRHANGLPVCRMYCGTDFSDETTQGPIINFNILRATGEYVGYSKVEKLANLFKIHLRTGCFCNTGACQQYLELSNEQVKSNFHAGHVCGDQMDILDGQPTGSIRISFGYMSSFSDAWKFLQFIDECFVEKNLMLPEQNHCKITETLKENMLEFNRTSTRVASHELERCDNMSSTCRSATGIVEVNGIVDDIHVAATASTNSDTTAVYGSVNSKREDLMLEKICLYPIKSCAAFKVLKWQIGRRGFLYDRQWMVVNDSGVSISQKREPRLCLIIPTINLAERTLVVNAPEMPTLTIPLEHPLIHEASTRKTRVNICGDSTDRSFEIENQSTTRYKSCTSSEHGSEKPRPWPCHQRVQSVDCGDEAAGWLAEFLKKKCRLVQQKSDDCRILNVNDDSKDSMKHYLSLANTSQYLLVSRASIDELKRHIDMYNVEGSDTIDGNELLDRFRGNLIISGGKAFDEDEWRALKIGKEIFKFQGLCTRCRMIGHDQKTGEKTTEPLKTLGKIRGTKTSTFGINLVHFPIKEQGEDQDNSYWLHVGDPVELILVTCW